MRLPSALRRVGGSGVFVVVAGVVYQSSCIPTGVCDPAPPSKPPPFDTRLPPTLCCCGLFQRGADGMLSALPSSRAWCVGSWAQNSGRAQETAHAMTGWAGLCSVSNWLALRVVPNKIRRAKRGCWTGSHKKHDCPPKPRLMMIETKKWDLPPEWL